MSVQISGVRVELRDWAVADMGPYESWLSPDQPWKRLDAPYYASPAPGELPAHIAKKLAEIKSVEPASTRKSMVIESMETHEFIGQVNRYWISEETRWLAVGIVLFDPKQWGRGLGFEALGLWCQYLWYQLPELARLDLRTWSGNVGMMRLAEKLGFREEARFRKARIVEGIFYDGMGYGVLREEWLARYPVGFSSRSNVTIE